MYETACQECTVDGISTASYVGESARSACERMSEHLEDARNFRKDSHMYKHWVNQHGGKETLFSFKIISFHSSALERQVGRLSEFSELELVKF